MTSSAEKGVEIRNLRRVFGPFVALDSISFRFEPGSVHGFIGPNGAGKTTTMRILATIDLPDSGDALINGISSVNHPEEVRKRIGFVPDWFSGYTATSVHEYLDFYARTYRIRGGKRTRVLGEIEDFTGLTPFRDKLLTELSRGMQQRVTLGRALLNDPDVLLMDEPAANLDPRARIELRELVKILASQGKAILISSHILPELSEMCDSVTILDKGKILVSGGIDTIKHSLHPHTLIRVRAFCGTALLHRTLLELPGITHVIAEAEYCSFECDSGDELAAGLLKSLLERGIPVCEFSPQNEGLEDLFMQITSQDSAEKEMKS